jgi:hypothetical protein
MRDPALDDTVARMDERPRNDDESAPRQEDAGAERHPGAPGQDTAPAGGLRRLEWGFGLTRVALGVHRGSGPAAVACFALLVVLYAVPGARVVVHPVGSLVAAGALFVGARILATAIAAAGWIAFPSDWRALLSGGASNVDRGDQPLRPLPSVREQSVRRERARDRSLSAPGAATARGTMR